MLENFSLKEVIRMYINKFTNRENDIYFGRLSGSDYIKNVSKIEDMHLKYENRKVYGSYYNNIFVEIRHCKKNEEKYLNYSYCIYIFDNLKEEICILYFKNKEETFKFAKENKLICIN